MQQEFLTEQDIRIQQDLHIQQDLYVSERVPPWMEGAHICLCFSLLMFPACPKGRKAAGLKGRVMENVVNVAETLGNGACC